MHGDIDFLQRQEIRGEAGPRLFHFGVLLMSSKIRVLSTCMSY